MTAQNNVHSMKEHANRIKKSKHEVGDIQASLEELLDSNDFIEDARKAAIQYECRLLFEFPASLIDGNWDKGAAILCPHEKGYQVNFLLYKDADKEISLIEASEAPAHLVNFACSFANILTVLPECDQTTIQ